jgi:hypothetical protein
MGLFDWFPKLQAKKAAEQRHQQAREEAARRLKGTKDIVLTWLDGTLGPVGKRMNDVFVGLFQNALTKEQSPEEKGVGRPDMTSVQYQIFADKLEEFGKSVIEERFPAELGDIYVTLKDIGTIPGYEQPALDTYITLLGEKVDAWAMDLLLDALAWGMERLEGMGEEAEEEFRAHSMRHIAPLMARWMATEIRYGRNPFSDDKTGDTEAQKP